MPRPHLKIPGPPVGNTWTFALLVVGALSLAGFAADFATAGRGFPALAWPDSGLLLAAFVVFQLLVWAALRRTPVFAGLAGGRLAVVTLALLGIWAVFLGSLPQVVRGESAPIFQRVMQAPPFVFLLMLLACNLAWGILKHLSRGIGFSSMFLLNHLGVYVVISTALFGAGDVARFDIWVREKQMAWTGTAGDAHFEMPFALHLHRFGIEHYPPQLTIIDGESAEILLPDCVDMLTLVPETTASLLDFEVRVERLTTEAPWSVPGDAIPAAYIAVADAEGNTAEGWVSCGSALMPPVFVGLGNIAFAMPEPRARLYESELTVVRPAGENVDATVRVNQPLRVAGWWLYQKGYRLEGGPDARFSQIEAVRDPWLPVIYAGFALMAAGAALGFGRAGMLLRALKTPPEAGA